MYQACMIVIILSTYERPNRRRVGNSMRSRRPFYRLGGLALLLGALMFSLTKARGYVDPDDSLLGYFIFGGFALWLVGVVALYLRYGPVSGRLGKIGLATA